MAEPKVGSDSLASDGKESSSPVQRTAITVGGAYAGEPSIGASASGRTVTVYPSGGFFTIDVAPAQQAPLGCALISSPR